MMSELGKSAFELVNSYYRKGFAARLKQTRLSAGLTRQQLGNKLQLSANGIGQYEIGRREPSLGGLVRLAKILNVSTDWLLGVK